MMMMMYDDDDDDDEDDHDPTLRKPTDVYEHSDFFIIIRTANPSASAQQRGCRERLRNARAHRTVRDVTDRRESVPNMHNVSSFGFF